MFRLHTLVLIIVCFLAGMGGNYFSNIVFAKQDSTNLIKEHIIARSIVIVDNKNQPRAGLGFDPDGFPVIFIKDEKGKVRVVLGCAATGPILFLTDPKESTNLFLRTSDNGLSSIGIVKSGELNPRLMMAYSPDQGPSLGLFDENNIGKAIISVTDGNPSVTLLDQDKKPAIAMISKKGKGSLLGVWNSQNEPRISLGLLDDKPTFFMYEKYQTGLLFNMQSGGKPALALMDGGSPIWSATGAVPSAPKLPPMDDMLHEITR